MRFCGEVTQYAPQRATALTRRALWVRYCGPGVGGLGRSGSGWGAGRAENLRGVVWEGLGSPGKVLEFWRRRVGELGCSKAS